MTITRDVNAVSVEEIDDALVIGFAELDSLGVPQQYLLLQRSLDPEENQPGSDGIYLERDDQAFSGYGGIKRFVLSRDRVLMELDDTVGGLIGAPEVWHAVTLGFSIDDTTFAALRTGLTRLFEGCTCFTEQV